MKQVLDLILGPHETPVTLGLRRQDTFWRYQILQGLQGLWMLAGCVAIVGADRPGSASSGKQAWNSFSQKCPL